MEKSHIFIIKILGITYVLPKVVEDEMSSIDCQNNPADNCHLFEEVIIHPKITSDNISAIFVT
ncbi:hypothetical protein KY290_013024 [Solanum tuberosum]|uniref:Uncharacterized protein n=1 Tax=Solanum tuberosum TaxID=4113 RepID=A0ABQ7VKV9_SOLTU|nr:hypothetical protein KY285_012790 [Solanum tuberosum]KAH0769043.1 hypothetical protein KY290_013024 [Solanum tuberosum]